MSTLTSPPATPAYFSLGLVPGHCGQPTKHLPIGNFMAMALWVAVLGGHLTARVILGMPLRQGGDSGPIHQLTAALECLASITAMRRSPAGGG